MLGAGLMGAGIATVSVQAGLDIVLIDRDQAAADKGKAHIADELDKLVKRGRLDAGQARRAAGQGHRDAGLRRAQGLPARDRGGVREPRGQGRGHQEGRGRAAAPRRCSRPTPRPCRSPAWPKPRRGRRTSSACISSRRSRRCRWSRSSSARRPRRRRSPARMDFVQKIRKTPIVVNDSRGFFTCRVCGAFISEGHRMLKEGVPAADDRELRALRRHAGRPAVAQRRGRDRPLVEDHGPDAEATPRRPARSTRARGTEDMLELMVKKLERFGRKNGKGFYEYPADGKKRLWPELRSTSRPIPSCSTARARTSAPRRTRSRSACSTCRRSTPRAASKRTC